MVFLAVTEQGLHEALKFSETTKVEIWCGSDAISTSDFEKHVGGGISRFTYPLANEGPDVISGAVETIKDHHPGQVVWVESAQ